MESLPVLCSVFFFIAILIVVGGPFGSSFWVPRIGLRTAALSVALMVWLGYALAFGKRVSWAPSWLRVLAYFHLAVLLGIVSVGLVFIGVPLITDLSRQGQAFWAIAATGGLLFVSAILACVIRQAYRVANKARLRMEKNVLLLLSSTTADDVD